MSVYPPSCNVFLKIMNIIQMVVILSLEVVPVELAKSPKTKPNIHRGKDKSLIYALCGKCVDFLYE
ncbi:hypothetical protein Lalb_Chr00c01g0403941 [Lupinus albus]|uniref:Uncharacterized protein n=1 Tax=Lupinus albus TaxID=3870 RepID=A0A6A4NCV1_LUPAL|nr:hypothetical protein Lalb_Chr00c01g0403941 [Lupinus albus]